MVERVLCMHEVPGSMPGSSSFFFLFQDCISGSRKLFTSHRNWIGGLAHMVESRALHARGTGINARILQFLFLFQDCVSGSKVVHKSS